MDFSFEMPFDPENLPEDMPEEVKQTIRNQHAAHQHHQMLSDQTAHDVVAFIKGLDEHNLMLLRGLVNALAMGTETTHGYYFGLMSVELEKFGICLACGKKHDDQLKELLSEAEESIAENVAKLGNTELKVGTPDCTICGRDDDHGTHQALELGGHLSHKYWPPDQVFVQVNNPDAINANDQSWANFMRQMSGEDILLLDNYFVNLVKMEFPKVSCKGCGADYPSLRDRMLRPKGRDGCEYCNQKEKWG